MLRTIFLRGMAQFAPPPNMIRVKKMYFGKKSIVNVHEQQKYMYWFKNKHTNKEDIKLINGMS